MKTSTKSFLIVFSIVIVLVIALVVIFRVFVMEGFIKLERNFVERNIVRTHEILQERIKILEAKASDWAHRNDTYDFIDNPGEDYIRLNLNAQALGDFKINFALFLNVEGRLICARGMDLDSSTIVDIPKRLKDFLVPESIILSHYKETSLVSGLLLLPENPPLMFASTPILTSDKKGPIRGTLILARYLDDGEIKTINEALQADVSVYRFNDPFLPEDVKSVKDSLLGETVVAVEPLSDNTIAGYTILHDVFKKPILIMKIGMPRDIFRHGNVAMLYFLMGLFFVGVVLGMAIYMPLRHEIRSREQTESKLAKLNAAFISLGVDPKSNIERLTALCGEVLGATYVLYTHIEEGMVKYIGKWNVPSDFQETDNPDQHVGCDMIQSDNKEAKVVRNLHKAHYAKIDANVLKYDLQTYVGQILRLGKNMSGLLSVFFQKNISLGPEEKRIISIIVSAINVEENRWKEEEVLKESQKRFQDVAENSGDWIWEVDAKGRYTYTNSVVGDILGFVPEEVQGKYFFDFFVKDGRDELRTQVLTAFSRKEPLKKFINRNIRKDGREVILETSGSPIISHEARLLGYRGIARDITESKTAEEALKKAMDMKSEFVSVVSHELRTPLTAIKEGISIVSDGSVGKITSEQKDFLETSKRNVDRLSRLINDVLDYQKLDADRMEYDVQRNDMNQLVEEVVATMKPVAEKKGLKLVMDLDRRLYEFKFDHDRITQVLTNLVNNALKFTDQGDITIKTRMDEGSLVVSVRDTGIGIDPADLKKLFQAFTQIAVGKDRKMGSTGLGLAICKKIVHQHKGTIWVESEPEKGSTFFFRLPM